MIFSSLILPTMVLVTSSTVDTPPTQISSQGMEQKR